MHTESENYDVKIDVQNFFDQPVKNNLKTYSKDCNWSSLEHGN